MMSKISVCVCGPRRGSIAPGLEESGRLHVKNEILHLQLCTSGEDRAMIRFKEGTVHAFTSVRTKSWTCSPSLKLGGFF